jgi:signal transduction histidine kinase
VHIETDVGPVVALTAREGQLEQVLVNLTDNALRAVGESGTVRISLATEAEHVTVRVSDDGAGMSEEVRKQALEPFFTTRPAGEGSGLGLAIVASIVRAHRGTLSIDSETGKGTEVTLRFPTRPDLVEEAELEVDSGADGGAEPTPISP